MPDAKLGAQCGLLKVMASKTFEFCAREAAQAGFWGCCGRLARWGGWVARVGGGGEERGGGNAGSRGEKVGFFL